MSVPPATPPLPRWIPPTLAAVALLAVAGPAWVVGDPPAIPPPARPRVAIRVVPPAELPPVEPMDFRDLTPTDARAWNASVPFSTAPNPAARPFALTGPAEDRARAVDCMAAAMLYEAGDDPVGERAVGQVVINRVRHPAFPKTICGVVFQGQERRTGCQFTFTCDGAIDRPPNPASWERAQRLAEQALSGQVFKPVGHSTHYHTDWVVPYWSASLDKVAAVNTHLFFRWTGWWGTPAAFRRTVSGAEPVIAKLARWSPAHALATALDDAAGLLPEAAATGASDPAVSADPNTFLVTLPPRVAPELLPAFAQRACGERDYCKLMGWVDKAQTPARLPFDPAQAAVMAFSYLRDRAKGFDKPLWNCTIFRRPNARDCMKMQLAPPAEPASPTRIDGASAPYGAAAPSAPSPAPAPSRPGPAARPSVTPDVSPARTPQPAVP